MTTREDRMGTSEKKMDTRTSALAVFEADGIEFRAMGPERKAWADDLDVAKALGFSRPHKIRDLIKRLMKEDGFLNESDVFTAAGKTSARGGRPGTDYRLSKSGALKVAFRSETKLAYALVEHVISVYERAEKAFTDHGTEPRVTFEEAGKRFIDGSMPMGDDPAVKANLQRSLHRAHVATGYSKSAILGWFVRHYNRCSMYRIPMVNREEVGRQLDDIAAGLTRLDSDRSRPKLLLRAGRQLVFDWPGSEPRRLQ
jgi:hypothetical protein